MMMVIVDGELMDVIEMMVDKQADLVVNLEANRSPCCSTKLILANTGVTMSRKKGKISCMRLK